MKIFLSKKSRYINLSEFNVSLVLDYKIIVNFMAIGDRIRKIEEEIQKTPYNKATSHHIGKLKAKLSSLKEESIQRSGSGSKGRGFHIKKSGDSTAVLVGFPSVGKSTILNQITNAESKIGEYEFTTLEIIPGIMEYKGAKIQIFDIPGIITGASKGRGRGKEILSSSQKCRFNSGGSGCFQSPASTGYHG